MFFNVFDKKSKGSGLKENQQLADELHKPIVRKFNKKKCILLLRTILGVSI